MISIAMCTYNGAKYLRDQLDSLLRQTLKPAELHVGDEGSDDQTLDILEDFRPRAPFPVRIHVNAERLGYGENFIATARRCTSPWVAFCDQDDIWFPNKLERCAREFRDGVSLVAHNVEIIGPGNRLDWPAKPINPPLSLMPRWFCLGFCQTFDRRLLDLPRHDLPWAEVPDAHDVWIGYVAGMSGEIVWIDEPLAAYRRHDATVSRSLAERSNSADETIAYFDVASSIAAELGFEDASVHYACCAQRYRTRDALKHRRSLVAFLKLLSSGAYRSGGYERFGRRALVEDIRTLLTGR